MINGIEVGRGHDIDQFTFYWSFKDAIEDLQDGDKLQIYEAITDFAFYGKEPNEMSALSRLCWKLIRPHLEKSRSHSGRGAGAPIGNQNARKNNQKTIKKQSKKNNSLEIEEEIEIEYKGDCKGDTSPETPISDEEKKFNEWFEKGYPHVTNMEQPLTLAQWTTLKDTYGKEAIANVLTEMENWKPLTKKNRSAYSTAQNWLTRKK